MAQRVTIADASAHYWVSRASIYRAINAGRMTVSNGKVLPGEVEQLITLGVLKVDSKPPKRTR